MERKSLFTPTNIDLRLSLQGALQGEIYPEVRAVVFSFDEETRTLTVRYYLDGKPDEPDFYSVSCVVAEVISDYSYTTLDHLKEECEFSELPTRDLEYLDGCVYFRKEDWTKG